VNKINFIRGEVHLWLHITQTRNITGQLILCKCAEVHQNLINCDTQENSIYIREEHRLRVFENRVLRRIFGPKRDEVMGE
jgi:hypothetical protein